MSEVIANLRGMEALSSPRALRQEVLKEKLLRLAVAGISAKEAAENLGISEGFAKAIYSEPGFRARVLGKINEAFKDVDEELAENALTLQEMLRQQAVKSFLRLVELVESGRLPVQLEVKVHQDFLDRSAESSQVTRLQQVGLDPVELKRIAGVAEEMESNVVRMPGPKAAAAG